MKRKWFCLTDKCLVLIGKVNQHQATVETSTMTHTTASYIEKLPVTWMKTFFLVGSFLDSYKFLKHVIIWAKATAFEEQHRYDTCKCNYVYSIL